MVVNTGTLLRYARRAMRKTKGLSHRRRNKSARYRAKRKAKHRRARLRQSKGERPYA
jgi:hypothetical protein